MRFKTGDAIELENGFPVVITSTYSDHEGMAYRVKPDVSALSGADLATLKSRKPFRLSARESARVMPRGAVLA